MHMQRTSCTLPSTQYRLAKKTGTTVLWALVLVLGLRTMVASADTIDRATYLSGFEKELLREMNLARQTPGKYEGFLESRKPYYVGTLFQPPGLIPVATREGLGAVNEAIRFLRSIDPVAPLSPSRGMSLGARDHAREQGPKGAVGHQGSDGSKSWERVNRYGAWQGHIGENIFYGQGTAREMVTGLIIDDGVASRGHRENLFNARFRVAGVACGAHATYRSVCVITFAGQYTEKASR
jgi:uncharacterized protein YkwD